MATPLAHFLTWTCYGTWPRGRAPGWVDDETNYGAPFANPDKQVYTYDLNNLVDPPFLMGQPVRRVALDAITDLIREKQWGAARRARAQQSCACGDNRRR